MFDSMRMTQHSGSDDLLGAGLGIDGLRAASPPVFGDPERPDPFELRRRAIWSNWRGIADLSSPHAGGSSPGAVAGREYAAFATLAGAREPHRVLVQVPDAFDLRRRCVVVAASSGSRGIYGAIAVAGAWGLPKGCAVAYTDKGCGTDFFDHVGDCGFAIDGSVAPRGVRLGFSPEGRAPGIATKHAHSRDNPEADWGRHVLQAAAFALEALDDAFPHAAPFTFDNTRVIAAGISNGGGAVLRAAEIDDGRLAAVVAGAPNVFVAAHGSRCLYDYATEAALAMPAGLLHPALGDLPLAAQVLPALRTQLAALQQGLDAQDPRLRTESAHASLRSAGWSDAALRAGAMSSAFDLWRAVAVTYASSYGRYGAGEHPCGYAFAACDAGSGPRAAHVAERAAWWSDGAGIPPGAGVGIVGGEATCLRLRALWEGDGDDARRVRAGIAQTRCGPPREGLDVRIVHGADDGLVPMAFSSLPYVALAREAGRDVRFEAIACAQHFDAFLAFPDCAARYVALLPHVHAAMDAALEGIEAKA